MMHNTARRPDQSSPEQEQNESFSATGRNAGGAHGVTVLRTTGPGLLAKKHTPAGTSHYDGAYLCHWRDEPVDTFPDLCTLLDRLSLDRRACLVFGSVKDWCRADPKAPIRRLKFDQADGAIATLEDAPTRVVHFDVDNLKIPEGIGWSDPAALAAWTWAQVCANVPALGSASVYWQASSSAGTVGKASLAKYHFWCMADRPLDEAERRALYKLAGSDPAVASSNQPNYCAAPLFEGVVDPLAALPRSGIIAGERECFAADEIAWPVAEIEERRKREATPRQVTPPEDLSEESTGGGLAALEKIKRAMMALDGHPGGRNKQIYGLAFEAGQLVRARHISLADAQLGLAEAGDASGHERAAEAIRNGLQAGLWTAGGDTERRYTFELFGPWRPWGVHLGRAGEVVTSAGGWRALEEACRLLDFWPDLAESVASGVGRLVFDGEIARDDALEVLTGWAPRAVDAIEAGIERGLKEAWQEWYRAKRCAGADWADGPKGPDGGEAVAAVPDEAPEDDVVDLDTYHEEAFEAAWAELHAVPPGGWHEPFDERRRIEDARRHKLNDVGAVLSDAVGGFFDETVKAATLAHNTRAMHLQTANDIASEPWDGTIQESIRRGDRRSEAIDAAASVKAPPVEVFKVEAGGGKSFAAIAEVVRANFRNIVYAVPEHRLADDVVEGIERACEDAGVEADVAVWRGLDQEGQCKRPADRKKVQKAGLAIENTICYRWLTNSKTGATFRVPRCPYAKKDCATPCGRILQSRMRPRIWVVPHASLFSARKALFDMDGTGRVDVLIVDESIVKNAVPAEPERRDLDDLLLKTVQADVVDGQLILTELDPPDNVVDFWQALHDAMADTCRATLGDPRARRGLTVQALRKAGIGDGLLENVLDYHHQQHGLRKWIDFGSGSGADLEKALEQVAELAGHKWRLDLLEEVRALLSRDDATESGRIVGSSRGNSMMFSTTRLRRIDGTWATDAAIMHLDATAADPTLLEPIFGREVVLKEEVAVEYPLDVEVTVIQGAPVSRSKLFGRVKDSDGKWRNAGRKVFRHLEHHIALYAASALASGRYSGDRVLLVPRKDVAAAMDRARAGELGIDVETAGRIAGRNDWKDAAGVIMTASADPGPRELERMSGVLTGEMPARMPLPEMHGDGRDGFATSWWRHEEVEQETRSGEVFTTITPDHPDPVVLALYEHVVVGTVVQIAARVRGIRRAGKPCFVTLFCDHPVPLPVDRVVTWDDVEIGDAAEFLMTKGIFSNPEAMVKVSLERVHSVAPVEVEEDSEPQKRWNSAETARRWLAEALPMLEGRLPFWGHAEGGLSPDKDSLKVTNPLFCEFGAKIVRRKDSICTLRYRRKGEGEVHEIVCHPVAACAADRAALLAHIRNIEGVPVEEAVEEPVILTAAAHVVTAHPDAFPSYDAARKQLTRHPPVCPAGHAVYRLKLAGKGQREAPVYAPADWSLDELRAELERLLEGRVEIAALKTARAGGGVAWPAGQPPAPWI